MIHSTHLISVAVLFSGLLSVSTACSGDFKSCEAALSCVASGGVAGTAGREPDDAGQGPGAGGSPDESAGAGGTDGPGGGASGAAPTGCGNGEIGPGEECDQGLANSANAYGPDLCTDRCRRAPYCGDGKRNGSEACDDGDSTSNALGACDPECTGYYEKKFIIPTQVGDSYKTNLGGIAGADAKCVAALGVGPGYKALLVGGTRRATVTPFAGDQQLDWVIQKYRYYYNSMNEFVWRTDEIALLGIRNGKRENIYADVFFTNGSYPWSGYASDWTTFVDGVPSVHQGTCNGWTSNDPEGWASFVFKTLEAAASEPCGSPSFLLCVQQ